MSSETIDFSAIHRPVMLPEILEALAVKAGGKYLDGTMGLGGHSEAILKLGGQVCGLDQDMEALALAQKRLAPFYGKVRLFHQKFADFDIALADMGWDLLDGILLDLGVSSLQLDNAERGFSFSGDGPLDMRMDADGDGKSAWRIVNRESFENLREYIATYGEDPQAGRIARHIVEARQKSPIDTTLQLAEIVRKAYPPQWRGKSRRHPATRTFQALRMAANDELGQLKKFLERILPRLAPGGRLAIISFHSLEDRMVKRAMRLWAQGCICPKNVPICQCGHEPEAIILYKKPLTPTESEIRLNPRASSAKLRAAEKLRMNGQ